MDEVKEDEENDEKIMQGDEENLAEEDKLFYILNEEDAESQDKGHFVYYCVPDDKSLDNLPKEVMYQHEQEGDDSKDELQNQLRAEAFLLSLGSDDDGETEHDEDTRQTNKEFSSPTKRKLPCPFCKKRIARVEEHIRLLHRNKVYTCTKPGCQHEFLTLKNLQSHQLTCFNMNMLYRCSICSKQFHRKSNYKAHVVRHSQHKKYKCNDCNRSFVDSTGLRRHMLKHDPEPTVFMSKCCGKIFKSREGMKKHMEKQICGSQ